MKTTIDQKSPTLEPVDQEIIIMLHWMGFQHKRIAALFDINQGRISEIINAAP